MPLRWLFVALVPLLAGCVAPRQIEKARTDMSVYREQQPRGISGSVAWTAVQCPPFPPTSNAS